MVATQVVVYVAYAVDRNTDVKGVLDGFGQSEGFKVHVQRHGIVVGPSIHHPYLVVDIGQIGLVIDALGQLEGTVVVFEGLSVKGTVAVALPDGVVNLDFLINEVASSGNVQGFF